MDGTQITVNYVNGSSETFRRNAMELLMEYKCEHPASSLDKNYLDDYIKRNSIFLAHKNAYPVGLLSFTRYNVFDSELQKSRCVPQTLMLHVLHVRSQPFSKPDEQVEIGVHLVKTAVGGFRSYEILDYAYPESFEEDVIARSGFVLKKDGGIGMRGFWTMSNSDDNSKANFRRNLQSTQ